MATKDLFTIGELSKLINTTPGQIRHWERLGLIPPASKRVKRGSREDRRYTREDLLEIRRLRQLYHQGAPTLEESAERERRKQEFLQRNGSDSEPGS